MSTYSKRPAEGGDRVVQRGLRFICLNANISRQFEFIQASWLANPKFEGLDEGDPLVGNRRPLATGAPSDTFTRPQQSGLCRRSAALPQFVQVHGGAYFFMPGISGAALSGARSGSRTISQASVNNAQHQQGAAEAQADDIVSVLKMRRSAGPIKSRCAIRPSGPKGGVALDYILHHRPARHHRGTCADAAKICTRPGVLHVDRRRRPGSHSSIPVCASERVSAQVLSR